MWVCMSEVCVRGSLKEEVGGYDSLTLTLACGGLPA